MTLLQTSRRAAYRDARTRRRARSDAEPTPYDFRRPIQLSREHSRVLQLTFEGFARQDPDALARELQDLLGAPAPGARS